MNKTIVINEKFEIQIKVSTPEVLVGELILVEQRNSNGGQTIKPIGHVLSFFDDKLTVESTKPHWVVRIYIHKDHVSEFRGNLDSLPDILSSNTSIRAPLIISGYPYIPYDRKDENNLSFSKSFGDVWVEG